ncbi:TetR/AcrR family transcriptional regulator [Pseudoxanthobacter sp.]|uniref:TetR/AcrR family transcriptional regulator n=1 Tax=Pseudoxanthobacter sp. TaxID=1925742 RepID=UPI002FE3E41C
MSGTAAPTDPRSAQDGGRTPAGAEKPARNTGAAEGAFEAPGARQRLFIGQMNDGRVSERRREILEAAALLFAERGYAATSMRDIAERVGLLGGSLYYHIKSKEALFVEVHDLALEDAGARIRAAAAGLTDPWQRLEAACIRMLEIQLDPHSITMPLMNDFRSVPEPVRQRLVARRDDYERIFLDIIAALPLDPAIDRKIYRILLLSQLNTVSTWYRPGALGPEEIGRQIVTIFRHDGRGPAGAGATA